VEMSVSRLREFLRLPPVTQIGIVVPTWRKHWLFYKETFSFGPFERVEDFHRIGYKESYYRGEPENFNMTYAFFRLGTMEVEMIQPLSGRTIYHDFLNAGRQDYTTGV